MFLSKWSKAAAVGACVAGALALGVNPASAQPNWQDWVPGVDYKCGTTTTHPASVNIAMQTCIFHNPSNDTFQPVTVVVNNAPTTVYLEAYPWNLSNSYSSHCIKTPVAAGKRVACYGFTSPVAPEDRPIRMNSQVLLNESHGGWTTTVTW
jgi:hypothetical protein